MLKVGVKIFSEIKSKLCSSPPPLTAAIANSEMSVKGQIECGSQYHFTMETQNALVVPHEDGYTVYSSTQWVTDVQLAVANVLGIPNSRSE